MMSLSNFVPKMLLKEHRFSLNLPKLYPLILLLFALFYYGSYYRCGLYPAGEGGVEGMTALRLLSGKIPITDISLNYNLFWFYPIVGLFKIFGPSYTAIRVFFFLLATITGLLAFKIIEITTRHRTLAFFTGFLVLLLPGQLFRNYMAFLVILNLFCFLKAFLLPYNSSKKQFLWIGIAGLSLGLTFLIRIDLGFFLSIVLLGLLLFYPWIEALRVKNTSSLWKRCHLALFSFSLIVMGFLGLHLPVYQHAVQRGFDAPFIAQYQHWPHMIMDQAAHLITNVVTPSVTAPQVAPLLPEPLKNQASPSPDKPTPSCIKKTTLVRRSLTSPDIRERLMALNLYLPIISALLLIIIGGAFLLLERKKQPLHARYALILLTSLGCSLTLFPQYFFWRPDMVHLSEFMVPMTVTLLMAMFFAWKEYKRVTGFLKFLIFLFLISATADLGLYFINGCQSQSTGGVAISQKRTIEFLGANGVKVKLTPHEFKEATAISQIILNHSHPGEYVLCYPYNPEINFMTDRPSYRKDLYTDDLTAPPDFDQLAIKEIETYQPAVIVITDWPINGTEHSRFSNWASLTYHYIQSHYQEHYQQGIIHVFVRP